MERQFVRKVGCDVAGKNRIVDSRREPEQIDKWTLQLEGFSASLVPPVIWVFALISVDEVILIGGDLVIVRTLTSSSRLNGDNCQCSPGRVRELARAPNPHLRVSERDALSSQCQ